MQMRKMLTMLLCAVLITAQLAAQNRTVTGKVTDANGKPVANASVVVKGTSTGTTTNNDGNFSITVSPSSKVLIFSSIGLAEQEVNIGNKGIINAFLQSVDQSLKEVVVVGYGVQKKKEVTGAIAKLGGDDIENKPFTSIDKALQGGIAGLQSVAASGQPGAAQNIRLRGIGSISAGANPLGVIDCVPVNTGV